MSVVGGFAGLMVVAALAACPVTRTPPPGPGTAREKGEDVTLESYVPLPLPRGTIRVFDAFGTPHPVDVEIAATGPARERGLMWRKSLADGKGMLFLFPDEAPLRFWMRNTLIPLDMIFIGREKKVVGIVERAEPLSLASRGVDAPSSAVLEVEGGWSQRMGVGPGASVDLTGVPPVEVLP